jgi:hypothetical protein
MTPWDKLLWLQEHAHETSIEINPHRGVYESPREYMSKPEPDEDDREIVEECERRGVLVTVQCYPHTPIGFFRQPHWDLATAIDMIYETVRRDLEASQHKSVAPKDDAG